jgi:hypothetical protein
MSLSTDYNSLANNAVRVARTLRGTCTKTGGGGGGGGGHDTFTVGCSHCSKDLDQDPSHFLSDRV